MSAAAVFVVVVVVLGVLSTLALALCVTAREADSAAACEVRLVTEDEIARDVASSAAAWASLSYADQERYEREQRRTRIGYDPETFGASKVNNHRALAREASCNRQ